MMINNIDLIFFITDNGRQMPEWPLTAIGNQGSAIQRPFTKFGITNQNVTNDLMVSFLLLAGKFDVYLEVPFR